MGAEVRKCFDHSESIEVFSPIEKNYLKKIQSIKRDAINWSLKRLIKNKNTNKVIIYNLSVSSGNNNENQNRLLKESPLTYQVVK